MLKMFLYSGWLEGSRYGAGGVPKSALKEGRVQNLSFVHCSRIQYFFGWAFPFAL